MSSYLIEITTDIGITRLATSQIDVDYGGNTYIGGMVKVDRLPVQQGSLKSNSLKVNLSGVDETIISLFNNEDYRNRNCSIFECDIDESWVVSNVVEIATNDMTKVSYLLSNEDNEVVLETKALYGSINQSNAPVLGVLYSSTINNDATKRFGRTGPITGPRGGKGGGRVEFDIIEPGG